MSEPNSALDIIPDIGRSRTRDTIQEVLEDLIIHAKLKVGERFPSEAKLAKAFGVSRVMVREAMKVLEAHGLVDIVQGKGIIVKEPDLSSAADALSLLLQRKKATITDLWEARAALEAAVVVHACGRASQEQLQALSETAAQWSESVSDLDELLAADERFHRMLVECGTYSTKAEESFWNWDLRISLGILRLRKLCSRGTRMLHARRCSLIYSTSGRISCTRVCCPSRLSLSVCHPSSVPMG